MFWAVFGFGIRSDLVVCEGDPEAPRGGFTAQRYQEILREYLGQVLEADSIFMHDNALVHTAHIIRDYLQEEGIKVIDWPPYSPDLDPIKDI